MLASDLNNKEFIGAVNNPDDMLHVEFYMHKPIDKWASEAAGKRIYLSERPYVRIMRPGDKETMIEVEANDMHKARFSRHWHFFATNEGLVEVEDIPGWKLADWDEFREQPDILRELNHMRFITVEQLAGASDAQIQRVGMAGPGLREKAKRALSLRINEATKQAINERDAKIAALETQNAEIMEMVKNLAGQTAVSNGEAMSGDSGETVAPKRRGRPKKVN